jgi:hypothetical protein
VCNKGARRVWCAREAARAGEDDELGGDAAADADEGVEVEVEGAEERHDEAHACGGGGERGGWHDQISDESSRDDGINGRLYW